MIDSAFPTNPDDALIPAESVKENFVSIGEPELNWLVGSGQDKALLAGFLNESRLNSVKSLDFLPESEKPYLAKSENHSSYRHGNP